MNKQNAVTLFLFLCLLAVMSFMGLGVGFFDYSFATCQAHKGPNIIDVVDMNGSTELVLTCKDGSKFEVFK